MTRNGVGEYTLHDVLPLADIGWQIEVPQDHNGNRMVFVETEYVEAMSALIVMTSKPVWSSAQGIWVAGEPLDVPAGRWVDLRFKTRPADAAEARENAGEAAQ